MVPGRVCLNGGRRLTLSQVVDIQTIFQVLRGDVEQYDPQDGALGDTTVDRAGGGPALPDSDGHRTVSKEGGNKGDHLRARSLSGHSQQTFLKPQAVESFHVINCSDQAAGPAVF